MSIKTFSVLMSSLILALSFLGACNNDSSSSSDATSSSLSCNVDANCVAFLNPCGEALAFNVASIEKKKAEIAKSTTPCSTKKSDIAYDMNIRATCRPSDHLCMAHETYAPKSDGSACSKLMSMRSASPSPPGYRFLNSVAFKDLDEVHVCREFYIDGHAPDINRIDIAGSDVFTVVKDGSPRQIGGLSREASVKHTLEGSGDKLRIRSEMGFAAPYQTESIVVFSKISCDATRCEVVSEKCLLPRHYGEALKAYRASPNKDALPNMLAFAQAAHCK
ncbi:MAG: hypothetical protein ABIR96_06085 [Bdellovibrionota bacterium]